MLKFLISLCLLLLLSHNSDARVGRRKGVLQPVESESSWDGKWFPYNPNDKPTKTTTAHQSQSKPTPTSRECDDGIHSIDIDFDPANKTHSYNYLCLANRTLYAPNLLREAVLTEHLIPPAYMPPIKCLNEHIIYNEPLPTFGPHRLLAPKYGEYKFLPPQRWVTSLADGAIVMLYHPCAFSGQITALQNTLKGCLYRHIITPSQQLSPERPIALLAWGKSLQMSVVDDRIVVDFIKQNAKKGPITKQNELKPTKLYEVGLLSEAHLVTDDEDTEICGYKNM